MSSRNAPSTENPSLRIAFAEGFGSQPPAPARKQSQSDLDMVEGLLARCWREVDASELNIKMTDIVRLLEFKNKLSPAVEAEKSFWAMVDQMRKDELAGYGEPQIATDPDIDNTPRSDTHNEPVESAA